MKYALTAEGTRGDIFPMLALAKHFEAAGHEVIFCAPPDFGEAAQERGLTFRPIGRDIREFLTAEAGALHGSTLAVARSAGKLFKDNVGRQFQDLPCFCSRQSVARTFAPSSSLGGAGSPTWDRPSATSSTGAHDRRTCVFVACGIRK